MASSSRLQQDSFIDDDDLTCPLCVEEFDLSDRNFKPCPCGYQVCQFCYNNIKNNMNGLCPACRRPYDEKSMEWKVVTQEEIAQFKANVQRNAKKKAEQRHKEAQKREVESQNRKHLAGLRVVQKNLVYVVGLSPGIPEADLLKTLRGDKYFGQYGTIVKIVVSKAKHGEALPNNGSLGVYVTFARKEDAARCIAAVNGSQNGDRVLRAQLGTTKYCSAYLRNEICTNKQCMFLHEPGDNDDSYSRQDLSTINSVNTQRPLGITATTSSPAAQAVRQAAQAQAPIQQAQPVAAATQPMVRESSSNGSDHGDGSALPTTAGWAKGGQQPGIRDSVGTSAASSPAVQNSLPAPAHSDNNDASNDGDSEDDHDSSVEDDTPVEPSKPSMDPILGQLLKSISYLSKMAPVKKDKKKLYIPMWDDNGGMKRRIMREQEQEAAAAARLQMEADAQERAQERERELAASTPEVPEEHEPGSGSGQLGGEPEEEEREAGLQSAGGFHDQRRPSTQLPIQRGSQDSGVFGNVGTFSPHAVASLNGRSLTPMQQQQLLLLKSSQPQSGFVDQYPPGMGGLAGQSRLLQQQGHARQLSRYNFSNEGPSASKVGPNPKLLGQQSMGLPGNQFYGSTMPGPPPGLKSTGTPPNGMFGQSQFGGSSFGTGSKENSDVLRDMLRNRGGIGAGGVGGGQGQEAGKREFMFPFSHQYPSTSTPGPASGLLASLYGQPQPRAFQEFGSKPKKKGKKHRHANTSSSGGGGLVDLADPNILQARMPHQQQSNAGVQQGLFGGQTQEDNLMSMDDVSEAVDALVAENVPDMPASPYRHEYATPSRSATPTIPPGFDLPHAHPSPLIREESISQPISQPVSQSVSAKTPSLPAAAVAQATPTRSIAHLSSSHVPRVATPLSTVSVPASPTPVPAVIVTKKSTASAKSQSKDKAKEEVKTLATDSGLSKAIAMQAAQKIVTQPAKPDEDFPTLGGEKTKAKTKETSIPSAPKAMTAVATKPAVKKAAASSSTPSATPAATPAAAPSPAATKPATTKKSTPGILNITVPAPSPVREQPASAKAAASAAKPAIESSAFPPLPPSAPASNTISTSAKGPKTLRVVATPKAETPSATTTPPLSAVLNHPLSMPATRQPSIVSSTPASDIISDNASHTSASVSRPGSPPPTRIGSAPVRTKTKSQLKKARKEAMREMTEQELAAVEHPEVEEIGPIMGRKKKQKKPKADNAPPPKAAASRPETPKAAEKIEVEKTRKASASADNSKKAASPTADAIPKAEDSKVKAKSKAKAEEVVLPEPPAPSVEHEDENAEKPIPSPGTVLRDLYTHGEIAEPNTLAILNAPPGYNHRSEFRGDIQELDGKLVITEEDRADLIAAKPVRKEQGHNRIMLTPNGDCVRNLTPQEEDRYLQLQQRIAEESGPTQFVPARHNATNGFTLIGGRAVPNGPPTFFPPLDGTHPNGPMDPVSKIQRDEALSYINQYVLPSLSTNSQLERALNANALDTEMLRPADPQTWATWGQQGQNQGANPDNRSGQETPYGGNRQDGILASGLESMTAHFAVGRENGRGGQPLGNVTLLSLPDAESALQAARKETDKLEKSFNQMMKKNRRLLLGGH